MGWSLRLTVACCFILCTRAFILSRNERPEPFYNAPLVVSGLEETGWQMVFRATSGNGHSVFDAWATGVGTSPIKPEDMLRSYSSHYRDPMISRWPRLGIKFVKLALYRKSQEVAYLVFDAKDSDILSWFDKTRIEEASWSNVTPQETYNYFSIRGHLETARDLTRSFFINKLYHGCPGDIGNLAVVETYGVCDWDHHQRYPQFLYSDINGAEIWQRNRYGQADHLAIFIYK